MAFSVRNFKLYMKIASEEIPGKNKFTILDDCDLMSSKVANRGCIAELVIMEIPGGWSEKELAKYFVTTFDYFAFHSFEDNVIKYVGWTEEFDKTVPIDGVAINSDTKIFYNVSIDGNSSHNQES